MTGYAECKRCGEPGHWARECSEPLPTAAPEPMPPGYNVGVPPRLISEEDAARFARAGAAVIRESFGWGGNAREDRLRRLAREQVTEARAERHAELDEPARQAAGGG